jgi:hypothetical protein
VALALKVAAADRVQTLEENVGVRSARLAEVFARLARLGVEKPWGLRQTELRILNYLLEFYRLIWCLASRCYSSP